VLRKVWIRLALRHDSFKIVFACEPEQPFAICVNVVAVQETLASLGNDSVGPELAVGQRQVPCVLAVAESVALHLII
jgi:hypothetical protein